MDKDQHILIVRRAFGTYIVELRQARGIARDPFAHQANIHTNNLTAIERGESEPKLSTFISLAETMRIPLTDFMAGFEEVYKRVGRDVRREVRKAKKLRAGLGG